MALIRPSLPSMMILDAGYDNEVTFEVFGGDQYTGFDIEIYNNTTNALHFSASRNTYSNKFNIEANVLANGIDYRFRIRTKVDSTYSEFSDFMLLKCYTTPVCTINNLAIEGNNRVIHNQNYTIEGTYFQAENVALKSYQCILYDQNRNIIQSFDVVYQTGLNVSQRIEGFSPQTYYYVELLCTDQYDLQVSSGMVLFLVDYDAPRITQTLSLENESDTASVKISSNMIQIIFKVDSEPPVYINEQEIDLRNNRAYVDERINMIGNFTLEVYLRYVPPVAIGDEDYFLILTSIDGLSTIKMKKANNRIHVYKSVSPITSGAALVSHYASNELSLPLTVSENLIVGDGVIVGNYLADENSYMKIQINVVNRRIDVYAQITTMVA